MALALVAVAGWALFAFAGAYHWTVVPVIVAAVLVTAVLRPRLLTGAHLPLDCLILVALLAGFVQLVPVPPAVTGMLSPAAVVVRDSFDLRPMASAWRPLSLDPASTAWSLSTGLACALLFWSARHSFQEGGVRRVVYGIAWSGLVLAAIVFLQRASSPHHIYGFWAPITRTATPTPLGPFVNRNDLATWLLLALPLTLGYGIARIAARSHGTSVAATVESVIDERTIVIAGSLILMSAALVASLSRSGLVGASAGLLALAVTGRRRLGPAGGGALAVAVLVLLVIALQYADTAALAYRLGETLPADTSARMAIWRQTWPMTRDFIVTGVGVGAFERGMLFYQHGARGIFINHAHNEYLQVMTEGGLVAGGAALLAMTLALTTAVGRVRQDTSATFWIRAGAMSGLLAVSVQSIWDTGLRMPANAVLFAVAAAIALHDPQVRTSDRGGLRDAHRRGGRSPAGS